MALGTGWGLTGRLLAKHFEGLGNKLAETIANFDPETATEADRDRLKSTLRDAAQKLAQAKMSYEKERQDVVELQKLIETDSKALPKLEERLANNQIDEATVTLFCDELEENKARLPQEAQEEADAKAYMDELEAIVDTMVKQLEDFDAHARKIKSELDRANAAKELQTMRQENQERLAAMRSGIGQNSTALGALQRRTDKVRAEAEASKIVADIGQKPLDRAAAIDDIRKQVAEDSNPSESALERLRRLQAQIGPATT